MENGSNPATKIAQEAPVAKPEAVTTDTKVATPAVAPVKKSNKALVVILAIIAVLIVVCVAIVLLVSSLGQNNGFNFGWNVTPSVTSTPTITTTLTETPTVTSTTTPTVSQAENEGVTYPSIALPKEIKFDVKSISKASDVKEDGLYYAKLTNSDVVFAIDNGKALYGIKPGKGVGEAYSTEGYVYKKDMQAYLESTDIKDIVKIADVTSNASDPVEFIASIKSLDGRYLYVSFLIYDYENENQTNARMGIIQYDTTTKKVLGSIQHEQTKTPFEKYGGGFFFQAANGNYVVANLAACYSCGGNDTQALVINFATNKYIALPKKVTSVVIDTNASTLKYTELVYVGEESSDCPDTCPKYSNGEDYTISLP